VNLVHILVALLQMILRHLQILHEASRDAELPCGDNGS
jgi:hypothetical protein